MREPEDARLVDGCPGTLNALRIPRGQPRIARALASSEAGRDSLMHPPEQEDPSFVAVG
jgi:hypothetical protein